MNLEALHIISLDVPIPADYGGVIDIYFRAKALKKLNVKVILHCFEYGRGVDHNFTEIADEVHFYKRKKSVIDFFKKDPFIVTTRKSNELVNRLLKDDYPILMEGHHCAGLLLDHRLKNRKKFVRIHNIESIYYKALSNSRVAWWKKIFFISESKKLKRFDAKLALADGLFCLSTTELEYYQTINAASYLWPVGIQLKKRNNFSTQQYALFHGNLSVAENEKAIRWIVKIWARNKLTTPFWVAGKNPSKRFKKWLLEHRFITLIQNPSHEEMTRLIGSAKANLLITFQSTGIKLKLLNSLAEGKRCIVNPLMVEGTQLDEFCEIINNEKELISALKSEEEISEEAIERRMNFLSRHFDVTRNTKEITKIIKNRISEIE